MTQPRTARLRWLAAAGGLAGAAAALFWILDTGQPAASPAVSSSLSAPAAGVLPAPTAAAVPAASPGDAAATAAAQAAAEPDDGTLPPGAHVAIQGNAADAFAAAIKAGNEKPAVEPPAAIAQAKTFREAFDAMQQAERPAAPSAGLNPFGK